MIVRRGNLAFKTLTFSEDTQIINANLTGANLLTPVQGISVTIDTPCNPRFKVDGVVLADVGSKPAWLTINTGYHYGAPLTIKDQYAPAANLISKVMAKTGKPGLLLLKKIVAGIHAAPAITQQAAIDALDTYQDGQGLVFDSVKVLTWLINQTPDTQTWAAFKTWILTRSEATWEGASTEEVNL